MANAHYIKCICTYVIELSIYMNTILNHFDVGISNNVAEKTRHYYLVCLYFTAAGNRPLPEQDLCIFEHSVRQKNFWGNAKQTSHPIIMILQKNIYH